MKKITQFVNEKLNAPQLRELAKYLKENGNNFNQYLAAGYSIAWDKITADDLEYHQAGDIKGIRKVKKFLSDSKSSLYGMCFILNNDNEIKSIITYNGIKSLRRDTVEYKHDYTTHVYRDVKINPEPYEKGLKQMEIKDYLEKDNFLTLEYSKLTTADLRYSRITNKNGVIYNTSEEYKRIADNNIKRYKQIIAQNKAKKIIKNDDTKRIVKNKLDEIFNLINSFDYTKIKESNVGNLLGYSKELLDLFSNYTTNLISVSQTGGFEHERKRISEFKEKIKNKIQEIDNYIEQIKKGG